MNEGYDEMAMAEPQAGEELERLLARYARVRLDPSPALARRARAAAMEEAWRRRIAASPTASVVALPGGRARRGLFSGWSARRVGVSLSAAVLAGLMVGTSAFAASRAGGPLYETRLALETLTLPSEASARADARVQQAQARLGEALEAAGRHDDPATKAALVAYDATIDELAALDGDAAARALDAVRHHREILLQVLAGAPAAADNGLLTALANADRVIAALADGPGNGNGNGNGNGGNGNGNGNGGNGTGNPGGQPTPKPTASPRPERTPNPNSSSRPGKPTPDPDATAKPGKPTPAPTATPKPEKTPKPHKTPNPPKDPGKPDRTASTGKP